MPTLYLLFGLAGSGKSYYATEVLGLTDEFHEWFATSQPMQQKLVRDLLRGMDCTVSEIALLDEANRNQFLNWIRAAVPGINVQEIYFENDQESAKWNCERRTNKGDAAGHIELNKKISAAYRIPTGAKVIPITRI